VTLAPKWGKATALGVGAGFLGALLKTYSELIEAWVLALLVQVPIAGKYVALLGGCSHDPPYGYEMDKYVSIANLIHLHTEIYMPSDVDVELSVLTGTECRLA
jgi:hypothetical protein